MVQSNKAPTITGEWECTECGYTEEGVQSRRPSKCPECGAPASALEFFALEEDEWEEVDEDEDDEDELDDDLDADDDDFEGFGDDDEDEFDSYADE